MSLKIKKTTFYSFGSTKIGEVGADPVVKMIIKALTPQKVLVI